MMLGAQSPQVRPIEYGPTVSAFLAMVDVQHAAGLAAAGPLAATTGLAHDDGPQLLPRCGLQLEIGHLGRRPDRAHVSGLEPRLQQPHRLPRCSSCFSRRAISDMRLSSSAMRESCALNVADTDAPGPATGAGALGGGLRDATRAASARLIGLFILRPRRIV
jgi:hypothetical protein